MRKLTVVLLLLVGIFTSCEYNEYISVEEPDCLCRLDVIDKHFDSGDGVMIGQIIYTMDIPCEQPLGDFKQVYSEDLLITKTCY